MPAAPVTFSLDSDRVGWIVFDAPGSRANLFNAETQQALAAALDAAAASDAVAWVACGAKERIFIAGADLRWLQALPDAAAASAFSHHGQLLFQRLAAAKVPVVCAIHGACAGGGTELALACDWRIASSAAVTQIGLTETSIGTIPGWGGCVRLPRLIGGQPALDHVLRGQLLPAEDAARLGLVDEVVPAGELRGRAKAAALRLAAHGRPRRDPPVQPAADFYAHTRQATLRQTRGQLPALLGAIDVMERAVGLPLADALEVEARVFGTVTAGEACKNLVHAFFLREAAKKRTLEGWFPVPAAAGSPVPPVKRVGVVGAGVMGSGVAHWLASRGFEVVLRDVKPEFLERASAVIRGLFDDGVRRGKSSAASAAEMSRRIRTTTGWDGFAECDLVIEAIVENVAAKQALFSELAAVVRPDALLASNTSALPIDEIAGHVPHPERTLGLHFFNPVSRMPLVELIIGQKTSAAAAEAALGLVRALGKSPVICRSSPGFVVTRVLFFYLNAAVQLWESGVPAAAIDEALRDYGWPMGPLRLIDEVGVDVTAFIFGEMAHYFPAAFTPSAACSKLLAAGLLGRKNGSSRGFYLYANGREALNDAETRRAAGPPPAAAPALPPEAIRAQLMDVMTSEAKKCVAERVVLSAADVDFALLAGAGFPAFRGGLLHAAR